MTTRFLADVFAITRKTFHPAKGIAQTGTILRFWF
jgi:hypothetical protein